MNLRQKAKHYKSLAERYSTRTIQPISIYSTYEIQKVVTEKVVDLRRFDNYQDLYNFQGMEELEVRNYLADQVKDFMELEWVEQDDGYTICRATLRVGKRRY